MRHGCMYALQMPMQIDPTCFERSFVVTSLGCSCVLLAVGFMTAWVVAAPYKELDLGSGLELARYPVHVHQAILILS